MCSPIPHEYLVRNFLIASLFLLIFLTIPVDFPSAIRKLCAGNKISIREQPAHVVSFPFPVRFPELSVWESGGPSALLPVYQRCCPRLARKSHLFFLKGHGCADPIQSTLESYYVSRFAKTYYPVAKSHLLGHCFFLLLWLKSTHSRHCPFTQTLYTCIAMSLDGRRETKRKHRIEGE